MHATFEQLPSPSTGEGGVGVRISGAERPSFSPPSPPSPAKGEGVLTDPFSLLDGGARAGEEQCG
jgi:hypothetical protein